MLVEIIVKENVYMEKNINRVVFINGVVKF